jgi:hypothetical protein
MNRGLRGMMVASAVFVPALARAQSMVDSTMKLNQTGHWAAAAQLARRSIPTAASESDRCRLRLNMVYGLVRLGMNDPASAELKVYDTDCAKWAIPDDWKAMPGALRDEIAKAAPPLPKTGFDFSYLQPFWNIVDSLEAGAEPSPAMWDALTRSAGYRLANQSVAALRQNIELAVKPSLRLQRDSLIARRVNRSDYVAHIVRAVEQRASLVSLADSIRKSPPPAQAVRRAAAFLPSGATNGIATPLVAFAIFQDDAFAQDGGIVADLLHLRSDNLEDLLAHEFHHHYLGEIDRLVLPPRESADGPLVTILRNLRNDGIADQIDKPYPLTGTSQYIGLYNSSYAAAPATLRRIDSLLTIAEADSTQVRAVGQRVTQLLVMNGHPVGAYMGRTIIETFGSDSILPSVTNPFEFLRAYARAEARRGRPAPFSPASLRLIDRLERKHLR